MSAAVAPRRSGPVRALLGVAFVVAAACALSLAAFAISRSPSECGGDAGACPDGLLPAVLGLPLAIVVLAPIGIVLLSRALSNAAPLALTLCFGGVAAGCYAAGFVAPPVTDGTLPLGIVSGVFAVLALLVLWPTLRMSNPARVRYARGQVADLQGAARAREKTVVPASAPDPRQVRLGELHGLLSHGLATGGLADEGADASGGAAGRQRVAHLVDLHRRGAIDDDGLREALRALRQRDASDRH